MTDRDWLKARVAGEMDQVRSDTIRFAVLTVVLTPFFMALAAAAAVAVLGYVDLPIVDRAPFATSLTVGCNVMIAYMLVMYFWHGKPAWMRKSTDRVWEWLGLVAFAAIVALSFATGFAANHPAAFWALYGVGAITTFGLFGHAYEARDTYYTGLVGGMFDDPFTFEDDHDRAHMGLGIAAAIPTFVFSAYGEIFGHTWVWRRIDDVEAAAAAEVLLSIRAGEANAARSALSRLAPPSARRVAHALRKLGWIKPGPRLELSLEGQRFLRDSVSG